VGIIHTFADRSDLYIYLVGCYCHTDIYQDLSGRPDVEKRTERVSGIFVQSEISAYPLYLVESLLRMEKQEGACPHFGLLFSLKSFKQPVPSLFCRVWSQKKYLHFFPVYFCRVKSVKNRIGQAINIKNRMDENRMKFTDSMSDALLERMTESDRKPSRK
jgi:hypothetical protein